MTSEILILPNEIIERLKFKVAKKKKGKTSTIEEIKEELEGFLDKIDNPIWQYLKKDFKDKHEGLSEATIARAINNCPDRSKGAVERLRNLICYYSYGMSWIDALAKLNISETEVLLMTKSIRNPETRPKTKLKQTSTELTPFDPYSKNYKILVLPFRNPEKNYEVSPVGQNLADGLIEKNKTGNLGLEIAYLDGYSKKVNDEIAKEIGLQVGADMVIWGNNVNLSESGHRIYFHYTALTSKTNIDLIPNMGRFRSEADSLIEITEGNLQLEVEDCIHWFVGTKFYYNSDYENAMKHFLKLPYHKYQNENIVLYMAHSYHVLYNYWMARHYYNEALKLNPRSIYALTNLGMLLSETVELTPDSIGLPITFRAAPRRIVKRYFEKALKIDTNHWQMHHMYASFLEKKPSDNVSAAEHYEKALEIQPTVFTLNNYALLLSKHMDFKKSEELFLQGLKINNKAWNIHFNYAQFLDVDLNEPLKAQHHYKEAIKCCNDNKQKVYTFLGYAILLADKFEDCSLSQFYFEEALKLVPEFPLINLNYAIFMKGKLSQDEKARELYINAIKLSRKVRSVRRDAYFGNSAFINLIKKMIPGLFQKKINYSIYNKVKNKKSVGNITEVV